MKPLGFKKNDYYVHILLSIISFLILVSIYYYLDSLHNCDCFIENQHKTYKINIEFLKFYQILEILSLLVFVILLTIYKNKVFKGGNKFSIKFFIILTTILLLLISGYVSYNTILFFITSKRDCLCVNRWQKYILYIQGIFNSVYFLRIIYYLLFITIIIKFNFNK